jgi:hypothetical protein
MLRSLSAFKAAASAATNFPGAGNATQPGIKPLDCLAPPMSR